MKIALIGAGKMGGALARGILDAGIIAGEELLLSDVAFTQVTLLAEDLQAQATTDNCSAARDADLVILAVKPAMIGDVCREIAPVLRPGVTVLSIAAGVTLQRIHHAISRDDLHLVRAMPNAPCLVGQGAIGVSFLSSVPASVETLVLAVLGATGKTEVIPESLMNAVTGLSGSGPAYVAIFLEALADGGVLMGLPRTQALQLALQTIMGTAALLQQTGDHPAVIKDAVSSPAGTTISAIQALEEHGFRAAIIAAVQAATARSRELGNE